MIPAQKHCVGTQGTREVFFLISKPITYWTFANMIPGGYSYKSNSLIFFAQCFFLIGKQRIPFLKQLYPQDRDICLTGKTLIT